jgi:hypothetical protein
VARGVRGASDGNLGRFGADASDIDGAFMSL